MRPDGIEQCGHPFLVEHRKSCLWSFDAETVVPSITLPCHISLFNGVSPSVHGIMDNHWKPYSVQVKSLMKAAREQHKQSAAVYSWEELRDINRPDELDKCIYRRLDKRGLSDDELIEFEHRFTDEAINLINTCEFDLVFFYFEISDIMGHRDGWMSPAYLRALGCGSECAEKLFDSLPSDYSLIITADHGGHEFNHGFEPEDKRIPIWIYGDRFPKGHEDPSLRLLDIAPTAADVMGVPAPEFWEGRSVAE